MCALTIIDPQASFEKEKQGNVRNEIGALEGRGFANRASYPGLSTDSNHRRTKEAPHYLPRNWAAKNIHFLSPFTASRCSSQ